MNSLDNNDPGTFRELSLQDLKEYAQRWARKYSDIPILRILLYRHSSKFQEYTSPDKRLPYKYAVVFEVPDNVQCTFKHYDGIDLPTGSYGLEKHKKLLPHYSEPYEKLVIATQQYSTQKGRKKTDRYLGLIDARFKDVVYLHKPGDDFEDDWFFETKEPKESLNANILINEPHCILYTAPKIHDSDSVLDEKKKERLLELLGMYIDIANFDPGDTNNIPNRNRIQANKALKYRFIPIEDLIYILAEDEICSGYLPNIINQYRYNLRETHTLDINSYLNRLKLWDRLLEFWITGEADEIKSGLPLEYALNAIEIGKLTENWMQFTKDPSLPVVELDKLLGYLETVVKMPLDYIFSSF